MLNLQDLLNKEARLGNQIYHLSKELDEVRSQIIQIRPSIPPICFGNNDCGTLMLVKCPFRWECKDAG